jgi:hypothetical protein
MIRYLRTVTTYLRTVTPYLRTVYLILWRTTVMKLKNFPDDLGVCSCCK